MLEQYDLHDYQVSRERALGCAHARSLAVYVCSNSMICSGRVRMLEQYDLHA